MSEFRIPLPRAEVVAWTDDRVAVHHAAAWDAWLHGSVAVVEDGDHDVLVVPMSDLPVAALNVAQRLYRLGAVRRLSAA